MEKRTLTVLGLVMLTALFAGGCTTDNVLRALADRGPLLEKYEIGPGDTILIEFRLNPELNRQLFIGPHGTINLPLVPKIMAAGETEDALSKILSEAYSAQFKNVDVTVAIVRYGSKRIYVMGEVRRPGWLPLDRTMSLLDAVALSGGMTTRAQTNWVHVVRLGTAGEQADIYRVDLVAVMRKGKKLHNIALADRDVVYVPPTAFAEFGYALNDVLFPITSIFTGIEQTSSSKFTLRTFGQGGLGR